MRGRRLVLVVAVIAALAIGQAVTRALASADDTITQPFVETGRVGTSVHLSYADVEVTDVRPAKYLSTGISTDLARLASGVFVLVSVKATATDGPLTLQSAWLVDTDGRNYLPSKRTDCASVAPLDTGIAAYSLFCFEVPPDRLAGMHVRLARGDLGTGQIDGDDLADVDPRISASDATTWAGTDASYLVPDQGYLPFTLKSVEITDTGS